MRSTLKLITICATLAACAQDQDSSAISAQDQESSAIPRLQDGTPNFSGVWQALTTANWDIQTHGASAGPPAYGALLATPPGYGIVEGDEIPYRAEALAQKQRNNEQRWTEDPELKCFMPGLPRANYMPYPFQIFHSEGHMLFAYQFAGAARIINLVEHQPSAIDSWMGISNAHWEADTLVVDVSGFNGLAWLDRAGNHASNALRVVERYTFAGPDAIDYEATLEDPQTFTRPWTISFRLFRLPDSDEHLIGFKCVEFTEELLYGEFYKKAAE